MRVHVLQHVPFEGLGSIEGWLTKQGASVAYTRFYESATLPNAKDMDFVIVLGGPMSVNDEHEFPWLVEEKRFVASAIYADKAVLGISSLGRLVAALRRADRRRYRHKTGVATGPLIPDAPDVANLNCGHSPRWPPNAGRSASR